MSVVSGLVLTYSVAEKRAHGDGFPKRQIREWLDRKQLLPLVAVDGATAGWHPGCEILIGGYNHFDVTAFADLIRNLPWAYPNDVVLVIHPDDGDAQVIRPIAA